MRLKSLNHVHYIKEDDTFTPIQLQVIGYDNKPFDLSEAEEIVVKIGISDGMLAQKKLSDGTLTRMEVTGGLEFRLDVDDQLVRGANFIEVQGTINSKKFKAPSKGYYKLNIEKSMDSIGQVVTKITLDYFIEKVDEKIAELQDKIDYVEETREYFETHLDETVDLAVDNKMTPLVEVVNEHFVEYETLLSKNAIMHNNIYRGKYLGNSVTPEQYQAISSGTFEDLYIGDYWTINGVNYRIAGFNYYYYTGDAVFTTHHAVIVPDTILYTYAMNDTNTTEGGYVNSKMYTEGLAQALSIIKSAFSGHVLKHRRLLSNAASNGKASGWAWFDSEVELMTEPMVYGSVVWGESTIGGSGYNIGVDKSQLPLFRLNPRMINTRQSYWLRDVVSVSHFAYASLNGNAYYGSASDARGVRPVFCIS